MFHALGDEGERTAKGQAQSETPWIPGQARDDGGGGRVPFASTPIQRHAPPT